MSESREPKSPPPGEGADFVASPPEQPDPSTYLLQALSTRSSTQKRALAKKGLALLGKPHARGDLQEGEDEDDLEMHALLLRQLYLAELEEGNDLNALHVAEKMIDLGTLGDIARQDAARAAMGAGDVHAAIGHLRIAARVCPAARRSFHLAHLGSLLRFEGQIDAAIDAFTKANRWATEDRDLYRAQQALAEAQRGKTTANLAELRTRLEDDPEAKPYTLWVLGELCILLGDTGRGAEYLRTFLLRQEHAPRAKSLALRGEVAHATALLQEISA